MDPKAQLVAYLQSMQQGGPQGAPQEMPQGEPPMEEMPMEEEASESPEMEKEEEYGQAEMISHHDSIAGLIQVLVNMTNNSPKNGAMKMEAPSALEAKYSKAY
jgi:hypothetical protein